LSDKLGYDIRNLLVTWIVHALVNKIDPEAVGMILAA
jgi:hypothetical protein